MPEKPVSPNIPAILLIGLFLGIGSGVGASSLLEFSDHSVRSAEALTRATGFPVLASVPEILTPQDIARKKARRKIWIFSTVLFFALGVVLFHFFIMDLEVFWAKLMRKLSL
jgi:hypothetical protein